MSDPADFNCECSIDESYETLHALRRRMMVRLGYAAQANNPPPGMTDLLTDFLVSAQRTLYKKNPGLEQERFYSWTMEPGVRYYAISEGDTGCGDTVTLRQLDKYKVSWVGFEDLNGAWLPLTKGIDPVLYTRASNLEGWPTNYEIRACIEIWPAPQAAYTLWVKANFGIEPFEEDSDQTSIDSELVFLTALADAKAHYGQRDAEKIAGRAGAYLLDVKAGKHLTARYIPGTKLLLPLPPPIFLPLVSP